MCASLKDYFRWPTVHFLKRRGVKEQASHECLLWDQVKMGQSLIYLNLLWLLCPKMFPLKCGCDGNGGEIQMNDFPCCISVAVFQKRNLNCPCPSLECTLPYENPINPIASSSVSPTWVPLLRFFYNFKTHSAQCDFPSFCTYAFSKILL